MDNLENPEVDSGFSRIMGRMLARPDALDRLAQTLAIHPVAAVLGPRQCGKTTLARMFAAEREHAVFDLENPVDRQRLSAPLQALGSLGGLVILDEIQRRPDLLDLLRVLVDRPGATTRFLILGSASPDLVRGVSQSLAGRIGFVDLGGFTLKEVGAKQMERSWLRGGFPRSFLAADDASSLAWRQAFLRTFLERDIPQLGITVPAETMRRFWTMVAHYHGQRWNASEFARSLGTSEKTTRRYLDILAGAFVVRVLPAWFENVGKRQTKAPRVYVRDSGLLHTLLQLATLNDVRGHPKLGASWEGFALGEVLAELDARDAWFWRSHGGAELDLFVRVSGRRFGFEFKYADAPRTTRSMHVAAEDLGLEHLYVVYPGDVRYALTEKVTALPLREVASWNTGLRGASDGS